MYHIETDDFFYHDVALEVRKKIDTSDYPEKHSWGIETGVKKKVIGKFKGEVAGQQITHFVGLRAKLYSFKIEDSEIKYAKGIKKECYKKEITFNDYNQCLFSGEEQMRQMNIIKSKNHDIYSITMNKIALSENDDERVIMEDKIHTKSIRINKKFK